MIYIDIERCENVGNGQNKGLMLESEIIEYYVISERTFIFIYDIDINVNLYILNMKFLFNLMQNVRAMNIRQEETCWKMGYKSSIHLVEIERLRAFLNTEARNIYGSDNPYFITAKVITETDFWNM